MTPTPDDGPESVLTAQLAALARYCHLVEAQRAVLRLGDAGMLDTFSREAEGVVADITAREVQIVAIRAAVAQDMSSNTVDLLTRADFARTEAATAARELAREMEKEAVRIGQALRETSGELDRLIGNYGRRPDGKPVLIDRTG